MKKKRSFFLTTFLSFLIYLLLNIYASFIYLYIFIIKNLRYMYSYALSVSTCTQNQTMSYSYAVSVSTYTKKPNDVELVAIYLKNLTTICTISTVLFLICLNPFTLHTWLLNYMYCTICNVWFIESTLEINIPVA